VNYPVQMTNDQFPMTNAEGREEHGVKEHPSNRIRKWSLPIGIWSFPEITREGLRE